MTIRKPEVDNLCCSKGVITNLIRNVFSGFIIKPVRNNQLSDESFSYINCNQHLYDKYMKSILLLKKTFKKTFISEKERYHRINNKIN